jgi:preprotein translocase subunit SecA
MSKGAHSATIANLCRRFARFRSFPDLNLVVVGCQEIWWHILFKQHNIMSFLDKFFGPNYEKILRTIEPVVGEVNAHEASVSALSDEGLIQRVTGIRHYDVQIIGGVILHRGMITEMRTGEGKTLVATLPATLNALVGKGVHIVTVNDYLARRDAVWMGQIYAKLGLSVGVINHEASYLYDVNHQEKDAERDEQGSYKVVYDFLRPCTRQEAYTADVTYGTNSEFGFDYLRDNIEYEVSRLRQPHHAYAIVDEIDSILIDEARTPLIISAPAADIENLYPTFAAIAATLRVDEHFTVDEKLKSATLTDAGIEVAEKMLGVENIYTEKGIKYVHHLETAVRAKALFTRDKEYVVRDGEVIIVDEFTGRLQPGRRWSDGLHQAVEAKEGVTIQKESKTFASITYQNYFRMYEKLSGMTGTALTSEEEFLTVYNLEVIPVPTNRPIQRLDRNDLIYQNEQGKFAAIIEKVKTVHATGQPMLIGTASIESNERLSAGLPSRPTWPAAASTSSLVVQKRHLNKLLRSNNSVDYLYSVRSDTRHVVSIISYAVVLVVRVTQVRHSSMFRWTIRSCGFLVVNESRVLWVPSRYLRINQLKWGSFRRH